VVFSPSQLLERLGQRLDLLKGARDSDPRQQTLRATIDWSYRLLDPQEQRVVRALSMFAGGCTLEAAEQVAGADLDLIQSLLDKSLLRRRDSEAGPRYWMLETIREHAAHQLDETGEAPSVKERHLAWVDGFTVEAERVLKGGPGQIAMFERVAVELPNVRAAIDRALRDHDPRAIAIPTRLGNWWEVRDARAGLELLDAVLEPGIAVPVWTARALSWSSLYAVHLGDVERSQTLAERGLALARQGGDHWAEAWSLNTLANVASYREEHPDRLTDGLRIWLDAVDAARASGDDWLVASIVANVVMTETEIEGYRRTDPRCYALGLPPGAAGMEAMLEQQRHRQDKGLEGMLLVNLGWASHFGRDWEAVVRYSCEAVAVMGELGWPFVALALANAANALLALERIDEAHAMALDALAAIEDVYPDPLVLVPVLVAAADLLHRQGDDEQAVTVAGAAVGLIGDLGGFAEDRAMLDTVLEQIANALGRAEIDTLLATGAATPVRDAIRAAAAALNRASDSGPRRLVAPQPAL
jgi:tetratricopeptide (TPR) repeat protein